MTLIGTRIQNIRSGSNIDKYEYRASRYGALDLFVNQTNDPAGIITPELQEKAVASIGSTLEVPVINFDAGISIGNQRLLTIADSENTSDMVGITFATFAWGFTIVPAMYHNNEVKIQRDFETKFMKYVYELASTLDGIAAAALVSGATSVFNNSLIYPVVGDALRAPWTGREQLLGDLNPIMAANDYYNQIHIVGNGGVESLARNLTEKGLYNEVNKQLQYSDKVLHFTNRITDGVGVAATGFAVNAGSVGMLRRLEREAILRSVARTGHEWDVERLPIVDLEVGTYYYESVGDFSAIAGAATADMDRARKEHYGFAVDLAFMTRYNSQPGVDPEPIIQFEILEP